MRHLSSRDIQNLRQVQYPGACHVCAPSKTHTSRPYAAAEHPADGSARRTRLQAEQQTCHQALLFWCCQCGCSARMQQGQLWCFRVLRTYKAVGCGALLTYSAHARSPPLWRDPIYIVKSARPSHRPCPQRHTHCMQTTHFIASPHSKGMSRCNACVRIKLKN